MIAAFKEHLLSLKNIGVEALSIPAQQGKRLRKMLESAVEKSPFPVGGERGGDFQHIAEPTKNFFESPAPSMTKTPSLKIDIAAIPALPIPTHLKDKKTQWEWLRDRVLNDLEVKRHVRAGVQPVFGVGNIDSPIFFCGEAPGAEEEQQGEPFVGRAGQLLTKIIQAMGVDRKDIYIANILNWRPEKEDMNSGNRPPTAAEMAQCIPFLKAQVGIVCPKVIIALGATAVTGLLGEDPDRRMGAVRGKFFDFAGTPVMVTYHPSYLLRNNTNAAKRVVWEDILCVMRKVGMPVSAAQEKYFL